MYPNPFEKAMAEISHSAFPDPERTREGKPEPLLLKSHCRPIEIILTEMIDENSKKKGLLQSCKKKRRKRRRGTRVRVLRNY